MMGTSDGVFFLVWVTCKRGGRWVSGDLSLVGSMGAFMGTTNVGSTSITLLGRWEELHCAIEFDCCDRFDTYTSVYCLGPP